jgi:hypothetical protein
VRKPTEREVGQQYSGYADLETLLQHLLLIASLELFVNEKHFPLLFIF